MALTKVASSQVATIQTVAGTYGSMTVNVNLTGFTGGNSIGAITMFIGYNANVAKIPNVGGITYAGIPNGINYQAVETNGNGVLALSWSNVPPQSVNGIGFKINFIYTGGSTALTFNQGCEIADGMGNVLLTTFTPGAITQPNLSTTAIIGVQAGDWINGNELPVAFSGFPTTPPNAKVGALDLNFSYDVTKLQFVGLIAPALTGAIANATAGVIHVSWANATPVDINSATNFKLKFNYLGGASAVNFTGTNVISNALGSQISVTTTNGGITQGVSSANVDIADNVQAVGGYATVPVNFTSFIPTQGALTMHIAYDNTKLNFLGTSGLVGFSGLNANASNGVITLSWANQSGASITKFNLLFSYIGGANCPLNFTGQNQIADIYGNLIPVSYTNGNVVQPAVPDVTVTLANTALIPLSSNVELPINLTGTTGKNISACDFKITYDYTKLTYTGITNAAKSGIIANLDLATHTILISWSNLSSPISADGKFLDLKFTFNGGAGNCDRPVVFTTFNALASSLADNTSTPVLANWVDGSVNTSPSAYHVSGGGAYCAGGIGVAVGLTGSQSGNIYQLKLNAVDVPGATVTGTGSAISFGFQTLAGTYTVEASNGAGSTCTTTMTGNAVVIINPLPAAIAGSNSSICTGANTLIGAVAVVGNTYSWTSLPIGFTSLNANPTVNPTVNTTYTLVETVTATGCTNSATISLTVNPIVVNTKVILQGAYLYCAPFMCTYLADNSAIPTNQPYNSTPWNYSGTEVLSSIPSNMVDWVLVELRTGTAKMTAVAMRAGILLSNGNVVDIDGGALKFPGLSVNNYYIVIYHRNHLPVMSANALPISCTSALCDFTSILSNSYIDVGLGINPLADLGDGNWGMYAGDGNADGYIDVNDLFDIYFNQVDTEGYLTGDSNLDYYVDVNDLFDAYFINVDIQTNVPF